MIRIRTLKLTLLVLARLAAAESPKLAGEPLPSEPPRLVVLISIDQMRADYLTRWAGLFPAGGFNRLLKDGAWFTQCRQRHASTETGPGHATLSTGCWSTRHGIIANVWYDLATQQPVNCVGDDEFPLLPTEPPPVPRAGDKGPPVGPAAAFEFTVPAAKPAKTISAGEARPKGYSPRNLIVPALADQVKVWSGGKATVVSVSIKDRSAILMGGHAPDAAFWFDDTTGKFTTTSYYMRKLPAWLHEFNSAPATSADRFQGKVWSKSLSDSAYAGQTDDGVPWGNALEDGKAFVKIGKAFKDGGHKLPKLPDPADAKMSSKDYYDAVKDYYRAVLATPFGNELVADLAIRAAEKAKLGCNPDHLGITDFLAVGFSSNDYVGHTFGPHSQEMLDMTAQTDGQIRRLLEFFDKTVGAGKYVVALTADHGIGPMPGYLKSLKLAGRSVDPAELVGIAEQALSAAAGGPAGKPYVTASGEYSLYLNFALLEERKIDRARAEKIVVEALLARHPAVAAAYGRSALLDLPAGPELGDEFPVLWARDCHPQRTGDVVVVLRPHHFWGKSVPANHGTPYDDDQHVPLVFFGAGVKAGRHDGRVGVVDLAPTLAALIRIPPPPAAQGRVLSAALASQPAVAEPVRAPVMSGEAAKP